MRRIYLIDCPGVVSASKGDSQTAKVLKGVVRIENLVVPSEHIPGLLERVKPAYLERTYGLEGSLLDSLKWTGKKEESSPEQIAKDVTAMRWTADAFLDAIARKSGRLLRGGEADRETVAKMVLNDWIRGNIPYFVRPPDSTNFLKKSETNKKENVSAGRVVVKPKVTQNDTEMAEVESSAVVPGVEDPTDVAMEWGGVESNEREDVEDEWSHSEGSGESDAGSESGSEGGDAAPRLTKKQRKERNRKKREPRQLFVQQDLRGVITKPKFILDDRRDDEKDDVPESSLVVDGDRDGPNSDEAASSDGGSDDASDASEQEQELAWDDVFSAVQGSAKPEQSTPPVIPSEKSKGKQRGEQHHGFLCAFPDLTSTAEQPATSATPTKAPNKPRLSKAGTDADDDLTKEKRMKTSKVRLDPPKLQPDSEQGFLST